MKDRTLRRTLEVPGFPELTLTLYGETVAKNLKEEMKQAFFVKVLDTPMALADLKPEEKKAVRALLISQFKEHSKLIGG